MRPLLLTAGATRNPVDAIRYLSAHASGRTGIDLAGRLSGAYAVHVLGSGEACLRAPAGLSTEEFTSTRDLMARMERWIRANPTGIVIHSAAVGDYEAEAPCAECSCLCLRSPCSPAASLPWLPRAR